MKIDHPLTIVHTEASRGWGGQDMRVLREARWFRDRGHTVHLVLNPAGELFRRATEAGFAPTPLVLKKNTQAGDLLRLIALFRRLRPDMVGTHSSVDSRVGLLAAALTGVPCRIRYRHVSTPMSGSLLSRWQYTRLATHVVTTGESICRHLRETFGLPEHRTTCVATGIDAPDAPPARDEARLAAARRLNLPNTTRFVGQVSVLRSWKGHADLIAGFAKFAKNHPHHHLVLVGGGDPSQRDHVADCAARTVVADRIHAVGHVEDPWPWHLSLDAETLLSRSGEGIPQSLMQAMLVGTPVIGTTVGGIPEIVTHERTGLLVPPGDANAVADALTRTLADPAAARARTTLAADTIRRERGADRMGERILAIIRNTPGTR